MNAIQNSAVLTVLLASALLAGCTSVRLEYDRMTGTQLPQEETVDGEAVNLTSIYLQGDVLLAVMEDDIAIAPLTGPHDPADPDQYDYITDTELETVVLANRSSPIGVEEWECEWWIFSGTCRRYHVYGIVVDHYRERNDGTRDAGTMGRMYDSIERSGFVNYYKHSINNSDNAKYLRSTAHEIGHAFNLNHCDGDGATTIMNQTSVVGDSYTYEFSAASLEHLQDHPREVVWPGIGPRHYSCPHLH